MATELAKAYVQIIPSAQGIQGSISDVLSGESSSAGRQAGENIAGSLGKKLKGALVGLGIGKMISDAIGNASEFETSMAKVSTLYTGTGKQFENLQANILSMSSEYGLAATTLAEAAYSAESAGVPMEQLTSMLSGSAKLAVAGFTDIDTALSATAKTMNAYGDAAGSIEDIQKILIQTQNLGITTVGELGASLANVTPTAAAMGVKFDQVGAALAQMTASGVPTAQATTQLRSAMAELGKAGTKADKAFRKATKGTKYAGMSFQEAMASGANLGDVFGLMQSYADSSGVSMLDLWSSVEAGNAAMLIAGDVQKFTSNLEQMSAESDVVGEAYGKMANTFGTSMNKLKESAKNFMTTLFAGGDISASFDQLLGSVGDVGGKLITWITNGLKALGENLPAMMNSLLDFGESLLSSMGQVDWITIGTTLVNGIIGAMGGLGTRLIKLISGAITSITGGAVNFDGLGTAMLGGFSSIIESVTTVAQDILDAIVGVLSPEGGENPLSSVFKTGESEIQEIDWEGLGNNVASAAAGLVNLTGKALSGAFVAGYTMINAINWEALGTTVGSIANGLVSLTGETLAAGFTAAETLIETIDWEGIGKTVGAVGNNIISLTGTTLTRGFRAAEALIEAINWEGLGETVASVGNSIISLTGATLAAGFTAAEELIKGVDWAGIGKTVASVGNDIISLTGTTLTRGFRAAEALIESINWEGIGETVASVGNNIISLTGETLAGGFTAAHSLISEIKWADLGKTVASVGNNLISLTGTTLSRGFKAASALIETIDWEGIGETVGTVANKLVEYSGEALAAPFEVAFGILKGINWSEVGTAMQSGIGDVWAGLTGFLGGVLGGVGDAVQGVGSGIGAAAEGVGNAIRGLFSGNDAKQAAADLELAMKNLEKAISDGKVNVETAAKDASRLIKEGIESELKAETMTAIGNTAGSSIVSGIISGINDASGSLMATIRSMALRALAEIKVTLGIHSPSSVMRDQVGRWIPAGIAEGIRKNGDMVADAMAEMSTELAMSDISGIAARQGNSLGGLSGQAAGSGNGDIIAALQGVRNDLKRLKLVVGKKTFGEAIVDYAGERMNGYIGEAESRLAAGYGT